MFVWWGGGGHQLAPTIQTSVNFRNFAELYLRSLKKYLPSNLAILLIHFKTIFPVVSMKFSLTCPCQKLKKLWKGLWCKIPLNRSKHFYKKIAKTGTVTKPINNKSKTTSHTHITSIKWFPVPNVPRWFMLFCALAIGCRLQMYSYSFLSLSHSFTTNCGMSLDFHAPTSPLRP